MATKRTRGARGQRHLVDVDGPPPPDGTAPLPGTAASRPRGRAETAVNRSLTAARKSAGNADARWAAAETLARSVAAAIDLASRRGDAYAVAQLAPRLLDILRDLRLTPAAAGTDGPDPLGALLADLATPTTT